ncbi:MAG: outer membrane protein assembly factor BamB family protein [Myxococcaceae bacterium]
MIRFRVGQSWKRERASSPVDAFGLDLDGVNLLPGASEEPLAKVVPELIEALSALSLDGKFFAQVSLAEAHLELLLHRKGTDVEVQVVSLGRPSRRVRPPVHVELEELVTAACRCARVLADDVGDAAPSLAKTQKHRKMLKQLTALERGPKKAPAARSLRTGYSYRAAPTHPVSFGFTLDDPDDLLLSLAKDQSAALSSLLFQGTVSLRLMGDAPVWTGSGPPFLLALELSRQAVDLSRAIEAKERLLSFEPAGLGPTFEVDLAHQKVGVGSTHHNVQPSLLAQAMLELGISLVVAAVARNKAQARNPYLTELAERCKEGLAHLRAAVEPPKDQRPARAKPKRTRAASRPLKIPGRLRRLRFDKLWEKQRLGGEEVGRLKLSPRGPIFSSPQMACAFSAGGELLYRRVATHGVAASADGRVVTASADRTLGFVGGEENARWLRDHDGLTLGPELERKDGLLITLSENRTVIAFSELTGREIWRIAPPRTQRCHLSVQGHRALITTDSGYLYGLDLADGQLRYRMHAALPFATSTVPWGEKLVALLGRGDRVAVFVADAHSGNILWTHETTLSLVSRPLLLGSKVLMAGERDEAGQLVCLSAQGALLWERPLHLGRGPYALLAVGRQVLVTGPTGAATLFSLDGTVEWRLGASSAETAVPVSPSLARGVIVLPGEVVRAVDPRGGQVLAEVRAGVGLCDLRVDARLNLFLLDDCGTLKAYKLASHLAVIG